jgi:copper homeostasis protein
MSEPVILEICADSVESALAAERGGAHRIELCSNLLEGGVTPSAGLISTVRSKTSIPLYVMVRPRGGDFCYSADEYETMEQDVLTARQLGADGIAFGILDADGQVDVPRTRQLVEVGGPLKSTFHRAFDMSCNLEKSLERVIEAGIDRVLTSGGEPSAEDGIPAIVQLLRTARGRIAIVAGGGVAETNVRRVIAETGVCEIHASVSARLPSPMRHRNDKVSMGPVTGREYQRVVVSQEKVRRLLQAAGMPLDTLQGRPART